MRWRPGSSGCKGCSHNCQHNGSRRLRPMHIEGGGGARERGGAEVQTVDRSSWASPPAPVCVQPCFFLFRVLGCPSSGRNSSALSASAANSSAPRSYLLELEKARTQVRKNLTKASSSAVGEAALRASSNAAQCRRTGGFERERIWIVASFGHLQLSSLAAALRWTCSLPPPRTELR